MRKRWLNPAWAALLLALFACSPVIAEDSGDLAYWNSVAQSRDPREFEAYLRAFPHGMFARLARIKIDELRLASQGSTLAAPIASIAPTRTKVRAVDRIDVDIDATSLAKGSNIRIAVFAAGAPDAVGDPDQFALASIAVTPEVLRMSLPPAPAGQDEIRLLYIPQFADRLVVAARASIEVGPGAPGAILASALTAEATAMGPVRFEAKYRDRRIKVEGQFLRVEAGTSGGDWVDILKGRPSEPQKIAAVYIGAPGTEASSEGPTEALCLLPGDVSATLDRVAQFEEGADVVVEGFPSIWSEVGQGGAVVLDRCQLVS